MKVKCNKQRKRFALLKKIEEQNPCKRNRDNYYISKKSDYSLSKWKIYLSGRLKIKFGQNNFFFNN